LKRLEEMELGYLCVFGLVRRLILILIRWIVAVWYSVHVAG
jgi:hypothetical protein